MFRSIRRAATVSLLVVCGGAGGAAFAAADNGPAAPSRSVTDTFFGTRVDDPYRNLENLDDPRVAAWMKAQAARAKAMLARIPGRARLLAALTVYDQASATQVNQVTRISADEIFFLRRGPLDNQYKLYHRAGGRETLLVDPDALSAQAGGKPFAINWYSAAPDGRHVAYGVSQQGSEEAVLQVKNVATGRRVGAPITRAENGALAWARDGSAFVFNRLQAVSRRRADGSDKYLNSQVLLLRLGAPVRSAAPVFGSAVPGLKLMPVESPSVELTADGRWALGYASNGTQTDINQFYIAPQAGVLAGKPAWKRLFDASANITSVAYHDDRLYLLSHKGSPRYEVMAVDLKAPSLEAAVAVVPASERVVTGIAAAADALYVEARDGNVKRLYRRGWSEDAGVDEVTLPLAGSFQLDGDEGAAANPQLPGLLLALESWTQARQLYEVRADGTVRNSGLQPAGRFDAADEQEATEVLVTSHDGAKVPMSILHKKGLVLDASHPTLLSGYASYGVTEEPYYSISRRAWLDAGGVYAVANPRGSGVFGDDWYKGGFQASKPNTWRDFIACAEYLIAQKYTAASKLGIVGGSAGGILVGRAMTERPDLFAAVVSEVGALDSVRSEDTPNGPPNVPEFGSNRTEAGFRSLLEMSTYAHIEPGVKYPAVMFTHGVHDPRVEVWESTKTAARLMAATASDRPVLLRLDYNAGHGIGDTKQQALAERADIYAFLLWQMGEPQFQPK